MEVNDTITGELKHVRVVHLSLVLVSTTILYLVVSAWTDAPELLKEVELFENYTNEISLDERFFVEMMDKDWVKSRADKIFGVLQTEINCEFEADKQLTPVNLVKKSMHLLQQDEQDKTWPRTPSSTLQSWRKTLDRKRWRIAFISEVDIGPDIKNWIESNTGLDVGGGGTYGGSGPVLTDLELKWNTMNNTQRELELHLQINRFFVPADAQVVLPTTDLHPLHSIFSVTVGTGLEEEASLPTSWLKDNYPLLNDKWDDLNGYTFSHALESTRSKITGGLEERDPNLLGITIHGSDIGYVGPILIFVILLYMLAHILNINRHFAVHAIGNNNKEWRHVLLPWVGAMPGFLPRLLSAGTIAILPAVVVWWAMWRVLLLSVWSLIAALTVGVIGAYCTVSGGRISKT